MSCNECATLSGGSEYVKEAHTMEKANRKAKHGKVVSDSSIADEKEYKCCVC